MLKPCALRLILEIKLRINTRVFLKHFPIYIGINAVQNRLTTKIMLS